MRLVLPGAGDMRRTHARVYAAMPDVQIVVIAGRSKGRVEPIACEVNALAPIDRWALLDDESIQAIDVRLPSALHRE